MPNFLALALLDLEFLKFSKILYRLLTLYTKFYSKQGIQNAIKIYNFKALSR